IQFPKDPTPASSSPLQQYSSTKYPSNFNTAARHQRANRAAKPANSENNRAVLLCLQCPYSSRPLIPLYHKPPSLPLLALEREREIQILLEFLQRISPPKAAHSSL
ncbi:hypothetical protein AABB24_023554, partial [Solanum stoloniferum]